MWERACSRRCHDRSHALRGNAAMDALRPLLMQGRGASRDAFPRRAWERSSTQADTTFLSCCRNPARSRYPLPG
ncbi:hypothetical protein PSUM_08105 [Pseudomonas umsongensis]|uniref:DUF1534 domain-containing protein n=1 Tax=Pseudomonas umsongensis TaxID=198618 RepID=A0ABX4E284_9PSED|nr:hypothetical protein PSUM_08105 [Pseudomonas umsongensis]